MENSPLAEISNPVTKGEHKTRVSSYFSIGALVGSVFVGLWAGGLALAACELFLNENAQTGPSGLMAVAGLAALAGLLAAVIYTIPVCIVLMAVIFLLARWLRNEPLPNVFSAGILGSCIAMLPFVALLAFDMITGSAGIRSAHLSLLIACIVGGASAGMIYRALLVYRNPDVVTRAKLTSDR